MSIVNLPDGFVALNEEEEAVVNDGTIKYSKLFQRDTLFWLEDNWGERFVYDNANANKYSILYQEDPRSWVRDSAGGAYIFSQADGTKTTVQSWIQRLYRTYYGPLEAPMPGAEKRILTTVMPMYPDVAKELQGQVQDMAPATIPHSPKRYKTGTIQITQADIARGAHGDYQFVVKPAMLQIRFGKEQLALLTIVEKPKTPLGVDKLNAHTEFQGMNLSRVLMIMLARETLRHAHAEKIPSKRFVLGVDSDVTNPEFWRLYSPNAETLLRRGDHQTIDLPQNPLKEG